MDIEQAKIIPIQEVLYKHGGEICPKCGHKLDIGNTNRCRCHKCNTIYSTVDFIKALYGVSIPRAIEILTGGIDNISPVKNEKIEIIRKEFKEKQLQKEKHIKQVNNMIFKNCIEPTQACLSYLDSRCIKESLSTLNKEYVDIKSNIYNGVETIVYRFKKQGTGIQKSLNKNEEGKRFVRNIGTVRPVFHKGYESNKYIIVEGIEDGLTCHMLGYNFICLNSVSNTDKLIDTIRANINKFKDKELLICTDYDNAGLESAEKLEKFFKQHSINYDFPIFYENMIIDNFKDINDYYITSKTKERNKNN